jgi:hypothetical protein
MAKDWKSKVNEGRKWNKIKCKVDLMLKEDYKRDKTKILQKKTSWLNTKKKKKNAKIVEMHILSPTTAKWKSKT